MAESLQNEKENTVRKGENACHEQCFQKTCTADR